MSHFSDYFRIDPKALEEYGAFNISLINDLPLFIDPFLLFGSEKEQYQGLHQSIIKYLSFLKSKSALGKLLPAEIKSWYSFSEVKQNWLGYSLVGNSGSGLGDKFGKSMSSHMHIIFAEINHESVTVSTHLEKAGLFQIGIGRDNISDFTCNLIKAYLLEYSQSFAKEYLGNEQVREIMVAKAYFDYTLERWMPKQFVLPFFNKDFVLLSPKDILTKDENWINGRDLREDFASICKSIPNSQLRSEIDNYFRSKLPAHDRNKRISEKDINNAKEQTIRKFPEILDYYIKEKEANKEGAKNLSQQNVEEIEALFVSSVRELIKRLSNETEFYSSKKDSYSEALDRVKFLKNVIETNDGYRLFYVKGKPIKREADLQIIYRLTWHASHFDVNREVNNGRGPVDFAISEGSNDKTLVEFKLASNSKLEMNLKNQVSIYEEANNTKKSIKVILFFDAGELFKVNGILKRLNLHGCENIILIDASRNKPSASTVK